MGALNVDKKHNIIIRTTNIKMNHAFEKPG